MKKFIVSLLLSIVFSFSYSQNTTDKVLTGVGSEVKALHTDTKDAISTLHQDAAKIVESVYTDSKSVLGTVYEDANKIVKYVTPKLEAGLVALAQTLKTTVAEVYKAMIMKQIAVSVSYALIGLFAFILMYLSYRIITLRDEKLLQAEPNDEGKFLWRPQWVITLGVLIIASIALFINFISHFQIMLIGFISPKYGAIQEIVQMVDTLFK